MTMVGSLESAWRIPWTVIPWMAYVNYKGLLIYINTAASSPDIRCPVCGHGKGRPRFDKRSKSICSLIHVDVMTWGRFVSSFISTFRFDKCLEFMSESRIQSFQITILAMSRYKWAPVSCSGVAAFHLAACVCTSSSDTELIRPVCSLMCSINSFHNRLMLHH